MKLSCQQEDLSKALQIVSRAVASRSTLPILSGILFEAEKSRLRCLGTDLEIGMETTIPIESHDSPGRFVLPGRTAADIARRLSPGVVNMEIDGPQVKLSAGRTVFHLNLLSADEYPALPAPKDEAGNEVSDLLMRDAIKKTIFATLPEDSRPFLASVLLEFEGDRFRAVATDINRLAIQEGILHRPQAEKLSVMVPVRAMQEAGRLTAGIEDENVQITTGDRQIFIRTREATIFSRLMQGQFPQYEQVIPKTAGTTVTVERARLTAALERAALLTTSVRVIVTKGQIHISATGPDVGQAYEDMEASVDGSDMEIGFNARYLMDFLKAVDGETIRMKITGSRSPALMEVPDDANYRYVVMPVILGGEG